MSFCKQCPYKGKKRVYGIVKKANVCIIGESPGKEELIYGEPFVGPSGRLLMEVLKTYLGLTRDDIAIINAIECEMEQKDKMPHRYTKIISLCRDKFVEKLHKIRPSLIISLGEIATKQVLNKSVSFSSVRGNLIEVPEFQAKLFVTYHPSAVLRKGGISPNNPYWLVMEKDLKYLSDIMNNKSSHFLFSEFTGFADFRNSKILAVDCEWDEKERLLVFSISDGNKTYYVDMNRINPFIKTRIHTLFKKKILIFANRPVDEAILEKHGFVPDISPLRVDVFNLAKLVNENINISLENIAEVYSEERKIKEASKKVKKKVWELKKEDLIKYNCMDAKVTAECFIKLYDRIKEDEKLLNYWKKFILPVEEMLATICKEGFRIDIDKLKRNKQFVQEKEIELTLELLREIPEEILKLHEEKGIRLTRNELLKDFLFQHKAGLKLEPALFTPSGQPSVCEEALFHHRSHPWVKKYLEWKKINKLLTTFFAGIERNIKEDGKIYPSIVLWATKSGRTACYNPNVQQIPREMPYIEYLKELFEAPKGWLMGVRDLSQSEIRIMGWLANEKTILDALKKKVDIHALTASLILGKSIEEVSKEERQLAKAVNFGFLYGASAKMFKEYAQYNYGINLTLEEAENFREKFFEIYYAIPFFHKQCASIVERYKYIRSPLGRIRRLPEIDSPDYQEREMAIRKAINFPIQSFSSDLTLIGMYLFWKEIRKKKTVRLLWMIHDSIFFIAREDVFQEYMLLLKECMEVRSVEYIRKHFKINVNYPVESDGKVGHSWADLQEIK